MAHASHQNKCFTYIALFNLQHTLIMEVLSLTPFADQETKAGRR